MNHIESEATEHETCCVVVAIGVRARGALSTVPRPAHCYWRSIRVPSEGESFSALVPPEAFAVFVIFDPHEPSAALSASRVLDAVRGHELACVAVMLDEGAAPACDLVLRVDPTQAGDALRGLLSPFEACWLVPDLDGYIAQCRAIREARVRSVRMRWSQFSDVFGVISRTDSCPPFALRLVQGEQAAATFARSLFLRRWDAFDDVELSATIDDELGTEETVATVLYPIGGRCR